MSRRVGLLLTLIFAGAGCESAAYDGWVSTTRAKAVTARTRLAEPSAQVPAEGEAKPHSGPPPADKIAGIESHRLALGFRNPPEQVLACGPLGFARLTNSGFEGWSYQPVRQTWRHETEMFTHVVEQTGHSYLLIGSNGGLLYYQPNTNLAARGRVPSIGPFEVWPDPRRREWLWVHYLKDDAVHWFELVPPPHQAQLLSSVSFPGFNGTSLTRLSGGQWLYQVTPPVTTGPKARTGWVVVSGDQASPLSVIPDRAIAVSKASRTDRVWVLTADDDALLVDVQGAGRTTARVDLRGSPYALHQEGARLAVITYRSTVEDRVWAIEVAHESGQHFHFELPQRRGTGVDGLTVETSERDVCLAPDRPWVIVGGRSSFQIIDYLKGQEVESTFRAVRGR